MVDWFDALLELVDATKHSGYIPSFFLLGLFFPLVFLFTGAL